MNPPIQLQRIPRRKKPASKRALLFLVLLVAVVGVGLAGCTEAHQPHEVKLAHAASRACEGQHAEWISDTEVLCLKEKK